MDLYNTISKGVAPGTWSATFIYYTKVVVYVLALMATYEGYKLGVTVLEIVALNAVISYSMLLMILIALQVYSPSMYAIVKDFCAPGHNFLKFWITLNFFSYLPQIPNSLLPYSPLEIFSWLMQSSILDILLLVIIGYLCAGCLYLAGQAYGVEDSRKDLQVTSVVVISKTDGRPSVGGRKSLSEKGRKSFAAASSAGRSSVTAPGSKSLGRSSTTEVRNVNGEVSVEIEEDDASIHVINYDSSKEANSNGLEVSSLGEQLGGFTKDGHTIPTVDIPRLSVHQILSVARESRANIIEVEDEDEEEDEEAHQNPSLSLQNNTKANSAQNPMLLTNPSVTSVASNPSLDIIPVMAAGKPQEAPKKAEPLIMSITDLCQIYGVMSILAFIIRLSYGANPPHGAIVFCNFSTTYFSYVFSMKLRALYFDKHPNIYVKSFFQVPVLFMPMATILVMCGSKGGFIDPFPGLGSYITGLTLPYISMWGGGDFVNVFLPAAIISLAWATIDAIMKFYKIMHILIPIMIIACFVTAVLTSVMSEVLRTPDEIRNSLLTKCITTPVAVSLAPLTKGSVPLIAGSVVVNSVFLSRCVVPVYRFFRIESPITRGLAGAIVGTLLVPLALDENGEVLAAGIGMASYGIGTVIFSILFAIQSILQVFKEA